MLNSSIARKVEDIEVLDRTNNTLGLGEEEMSRRNQCYAELIWALIWKENLLYQKSKSKWLLEGDANSRFYHI